MIINRINSGATREALTLDQIKNFEFPFCSILEQRQIVQELESRFTLIENLQKIINKGLQKTKIFRQSIFKKAFTGYLNSQDPNDEPASFLLQKIKEEKENYLVEQKKSAMGKPKIRKQMETNKTVLEILEQASKPILARDLWLQSKYKDNIEEFYDELKEIYSLVKEVKSNTESFISLKK